MVKFHCHHCNRKISAETKAVGAPAICPACGGALIVPSESSTDPSPDLPESMTPPSPSRRRGGSKSKKGRSWIETTVCGVAVAAVAALLIYVMTVVAHSKNHAAKSQGDLISDRENLKSDPPSTEKNIPPAAVPNPKYLAEAEEFVKATNISDRSLTCSVLQKSLLHASGPHAQELNVALEGVQRINDQIDDLNKPLVKPDYKEPLYTGVRPFIGIYRGTYNGDKGIVVQDGGDYYVVENAVPPKVSNVNGYVEITSRTTVLDLGREGRTAKILRLSNQETYEDDQKDYSERVTKAEADFEKVKKEYESASDPSIRERKVSDLNAQRTKALEDAARKVAKILGVQPPTSLTPSTDNSIPPVQDINSIKAAASKWKDAGKTYVPLKTPWVSLCVPKLFKFCDISLERSFTFNNVKISYIEPDSAIPTVVPERNYMTIKVFRNIDEIKMKIWGSNSVTTDARDSFVKSVSSADARVISGVPYHVNFKKSGSLQSNQQNLDSGIWEATIQAFSTTPDMPVVDIWISAQPKKKLDESAESALQMVNSMTVAKLDSDDVLANWSMNAKVVGVEPSLRPVDDEFFKLWQGQELPEIVGYGPPLVRYPFPIIGDSADAVRFWYGRPKEKDFGKYSVIQYPVPGIVLYYDRNRWTYLRGLVVSVLVHSTSNRVIAYEVSFDMLSCAMDSDSDNKWRNSYTDDDVNRIFDKTQILLAPEMKLAKSGSLKMHEPQEAGTILQQHNGLQMYANARETYMACIEYGYRISNLSKGSKPFTANSSRRITLLSPEALDFLQQHKFNIGEAMKSSR